MKSLLKELENLKEEKTPRESGDKESRDARPTGPVLSIAF